MQKKANLREISILLLLAYSWNSRPQNYTLGKIYSKRLFLIGITFCTIQTLRYVNISKKIGQSVFLAWSPQIPRNNQSILLSFLQVAPFECLLKKWWKNLEKKWLCYFSLFKDEDNFCPVCYLFCKSMHQW